MQYLTASLEDYLEIIYILEQRNNNVGVTDIALALNISKPSVNRAVRSLKLSGLVEQKPYGKISLTDKGQAEAESIYEKHKMLSCFLEKTANVNPEIAEIDACKIEHILSPETLNGIKNFLEEAKCF